MATAELCLSGILMKSGKQWQSLQVDSRGQANKEEGGRKEVAMPGGCDIPIPEQKRGSYPRHSPLSFLFSSLPPPFMVSSQIHSVSGAAKIFVDTLVSRD